MTNFWDKHVLPTQTKPADLASTYRSSNRDRGLPGVMSEDWVQAHNGTDKVIHRADLYDNQPAAKDYTSAPQSKFLPKAGETPTSYLARMSSIARHLEQLPEREAVEAAIAEAQERVNAGQTHEELRAHLTTRAEGSAVGMFGNQEGAMRAELGNRMDAVNASYRSNDVGYQAVSVTVPRVDIADVRQAEQHAQAAALQARFSSRVSGPSGAGLL